MMSKRSGLVFCILLLLMTALYQYHKILFFRPCSIHQWRQCDCLSFTLNYYKENRPFLDPSVCWIGNKGTGETVVEFPIIYYSVAQLWKIFGQHEFISRLIVMCLTFAGLYFLFLTFKLFLLDSFWSIVLSLLMFTSPIWVYYGNNFLPDVPSFSLALMGWYHFMKFYKNGSERSYYFSMFFFMVGGLIKISSLISFLSLFGIFLIETVLGKNMGRNKKIFTKPINHLIPFIIVIIINTSWYLFAIHFNKEHNEGILGSGIIPIWNYSEERILYVWRLFTHQLIFTYYSKYMLLFIAACFILCLFYFKKSNRFLITLNIFIAFGSFLFFILWYDVFHGHDYYMINLLMFSVFTLLNFSVIVKDHFKKIAKSFFIKILFLLFLSINIFYASAQTYIRYFYPEHDTVFSYIVPEETLEFFRFMHWNYKEHVKAFETIEPFNRKLGIKRTDKVISLCDPSLDITLYLMDQKGFTDFDLFTSRGDERMQKYLRMGAKYLFISDKKFYEEKYLEPYLKNKMGSYKNVDIYYLGSLN